VARMVKCARCEVPVFRALLVGPGRARRAVIDAAPDKYGIGPVAAYVDVARSWHARLLEPWQVPANHERRHLEHACGPTSGRGAAAVRAT
jgi:hypothetical protein